MILLWLGLTALLQSCLTLFPHEAFPGAAWAQVVLLAASAAGLIALTRRLRSVPVFGIHGQWLISAALLTLLLTQGGLPGHPGAIANAIGIDIWTRQMLAPISNILLIIGLWQALSNLARSKEQAVRALEAELHNAMTEMVISTAPRPRPPAGPRLTRAGLTGTLTAALEHVGPGHRILRDLILREPNNIAARLALHNRLREDASQTVALRQHGADFVAALCHAGRRDLALNVAEDCARQDADYFPPPEIALELAQWAIAEARHPLALRLLKHFDVRNPAHPATAHVYLLSAEALGGMGRTEAAQALIGALVQQFPDDARAAEAIALSARLAKRS